MAESVEPSQVEERASFTIAGMMISVINITPGAIGVINIDGGEEPPDECCLVGSWEGTVLFPSPEYDGEIFIGIEWYEVLVMMWFNADGTAEIHGFLSEQDKIDGIYFEEMTFLGTWVCIEDNISGEWTQGWDSVTESWLPTTNEEDEPEPICWESLNLEFGPDCDVMSFDVDFEVGELVHWEMTRM